MSAPIAVQHYTLTGPDVLRAVGARRLPGQPPEGPAEALDIVETAFGGYRFDG
jgi:hypothetical protein